MLIFSLVTLGLGVAAALQGADGLVVGLILMAAAIGAAVLSSLWSRVEVLPPGSKILVWSVATIGGAASGLFVVGVWFVLRIFQFIGEQMGVDFGFGGMRGSGVSTLRGVSQRTKGRGGRGRGSDWERILRAERVGDERVIREGGFTYIGGERVMTDGTFTYVGDDRVSEEDGVLFIGEKRVTREDGWLFVDGQRVEE